MASKAKPPAKEPDPAPVASVEAVQEQPPPPPPTPADDMESQVWSHSSPSDQFRSFLRVFGLKPSGRANRDAAIQVEIFDHISELRSFRLSALQVMAVFHFLVRAFDSFEDPRFTKAEIQSKVCALQDEYIKSELFAHNTTDHQKIINFINESLLGRRFNLLHQSLHLEIEELEARERQRLADAEAVRLAAEAAELEAQRLAEEKAKQEAEAAAAAAEEAAKKGKKK